MQKDKDIDKGNLFLLVIPERYEPIIFNMYHDSFISRTPGPIPHSDDYQTEIFHPQSYE